jgi:hypothetical protein
MENKWKDVWDAGEKVRPSLPKVERAGKWAWLKVTAAVAVVGGLIAFAVQSGHQTGQAANDFIGNAQSSAAAYQSERNLNASADEYQEMMESLKLENIPSVPDQPAPAQAAEPAAVAAMPAPVAAVAAVPVQVQVMDAHGAVVQQATRTVAQVWQASPVSRPQIEQYAGRGSGGGHQISGWTVSGTPFGSVHFGL